jgi:lathosterol oxidase
MDVILDLFDTFFGDYVYAWLVPSSPSSHFTPTATNGSAQSFLPCHYQPSTKSFTVIPSQAACMSAWPRENIYRQSINLFLIPWYDIYTFP